MSGKLLLWMFPLFFNFSFYDYSYEDLYLKHMPNERISLVKQKRTILKFNDLNLKEVTFTSGDYFLNSGKNRIYGTRLFAEYETKSIEDLTSYGFVQYIRGCHYETRYKNNEIKHFLRYQRVHFDEVIDYQHLGWEIDSIDRDPFYNSDRTMFQDGFDPDYLKKRYIYYRWNRKPGTYTKSTQEYWGREKPQNPNLYVTDYPGVASIRQLSDGTVVAHNISVEFVMCLYKSDLIPIHTKPDEKLDAKPLACFPWRSSYEYDFKNEKFMSRKDIHPFCLKTSKSVK